MKEYILVTGGAGYIGSHTVVELIQHGYNVVIVDNLVNSSYDAVARIEYIVKQNVPFFNVDLRDRAALGKVFAQYKISGVIHFAALKAVGESTQIPLDYYSNNVGGTIALLEEMKSAGVKTFVFSSSATVYGDATRFENMIPIPEHCPTGPTNPYGKTKLVIEEIVRDIHSSDNTWRAAILRYFNPMGAHPSGLIGEDPLGTPNNLLPYLAQVAVGRREKLSVFGSDYDSHDGTPIRDYVHVVDLARGHIAALEYLQTLDKASGLFREWNLGTGKGSTVFDVYKAFCKAIGRDLPYEVVGRRAGDVLDLTANPTRANTELKWKAVLSIEEACRDLWRWTTENPYGFNSDNYKWSLFNEKGQDGYESRLHTVEFPDSNFKVAIANYGATLQSIQKNGHNYVAGFDTLAGYKQSGNPYFGATIGRVANRIADAKFTLDGETYALSQNENGNCLHGGKEGYDKRYFLGPVVKQPKKGGPVNVDFVYVDKDGNDGFPGDLVVYVKYTIDKNSIDLEFEALIPEKSPKSATPVNLTNHSYFSVTGGPNINGSVAKSITNEYLAVNDKLLPSGEFTTASEKLKTGEVLTASTEYDYCFIVDKDNWKLDTREAELKKVFTLLNPKSSTSIEFHTTEPSFQFYTGDGTDLKGFEKRCGLCIEPGRYVNAVNEKKWENQVVLSKDEVYGSKNRYVFN